jgi:outer membrane protein
MPLSAMEQSKEELLKQASQLIEKGDAKSAYALLASAEAQFAGQLDYDWLLGTAAIESKQYTNGIFALERVLAVEPDHYGAREKLAQTHFHLGEIDVSKSEFKHLLNQDPSAQTAKAIQSYLSAIDKAMGLTSVYTAYLDVGAGWDSNVNSATSASSVAVPVFGGFNFTIADEARKKSDAFLSMGAGAGFYIPVTPSVAYIGNLQLAKKLNQSYQEFETGNIDLNVGIQFKHDRDVFTLAAQDGHFYVDDDRFRHSYGATAQWQRNFNTRTQASLYGQYAKLDYIDNEIRNADRYVLGANYAHAFDMAYSPVMFVGAYLAQEDATKRGSKFLDQDIYGLRAGGQLLVAPNWVAYASAGYESRDYQAEDLAFLKKRNDDQYDLTLGVQYVPARYWSIKPQISLIKNDSNIEINEFERATISINIRREFDW